MINKLTIILIVTYLLNVSIKDIYYKIVDVFFFIGAGKEL